MEQSSFIKINPADSVVVCLRPMKKGETIEAKWTLPFGNTVKPSTLSLSPTTFSELYSGIYGTSSAKICCSSS